MAKNTLDTLGITKPAKPVKKEPPVKEWKEILDTMQKMIDDSEKIPDVEKYGAHMLSNSNKTKEGRFGYLVALLLSSRTKDVTTSGAIDRLNKYLPCKTIPELNKKLKDNSIKMRIVGENEKPAPLETSNLTIENVLITPKPILDALIKPVGFYATKSKNLIAIAQILKRDYDSDVPKTYEKIIELPGIGQKMGNLMTQLCWGETRGISVDTHVREVAQRLGFAGSLNKKNEAVLPPDKVSFELEQWLPKEYWEKINPLMVGFGQLICSAHAPKCECCKLHKYCKYYKSRHRGSNRDSDDSKEEKEEGEQQQQIEQIKAEEPAEIVKKEEGEGEKESLPPKLVETDVALKIEPNISG